MTRLISASFSSATDSMPDVFLGCLSLSLAHFARKLLMNLLTYAVTRTALLRFENFLISSNTGDHLTLTTDTTLVVFFSFSVANKSASFSVVFMEGQSFSADLR